jgi:hypothetical protein
MAAHFAKLCWPLDQPSLPTRLFFNWRRRVAHPIDLLPCHAGGIGCVFGT